MITIQDTTKIAKDLVHLEQVRARRQPMIAEMGTPAALAGLLMGTAYVDSRRRYLREELRLALEELVKAGVIPEPAKSVNKVNVIYRQRH